MSGKGRCDGYCDRCQKRVYRSRKMARRARQQVAKGAELAAYPCPHSDTYWHLGHLSKIEGARDLYRAQAMAAEEGP